MEVFFDGMKANQYSRTALLVTIVGLVLLACRFCRADVGYKIVDTGQSRCYDNKGEIACPEPGSAFYGQDAQYQGTRPAYKDNGDGTITDLNTSLMWQETPDFDNLVTWYEAGDYAKALKLAGHDDWRLPTIKELYSIVDFRGNQHTKTPYIDTRYFDFEYPSPSAGLRFMDAQYWSGNFYVGRTMKNDLSAFGFNFADGRIKCYPANVLRGPVFAERLPALPPTWLRKKKLLLVLVTESCYLFPVPPWPNGELSQSLYLSYRKRHTVHNELLGV